MKRFIAFLLMLSLFLTVSVSALADYVNVKPRSDLNVRSGPGFNYKVIGHLYRNTYVKVHSRSGEWAKITYKGRTAYVNTNFLSRSPLKGSSGTSAYTTLRQGSTGSAVKTLQRNLNTIASKGYAITKLSVDGSFGPATKASVIQFQKLFGLNPDGVVGSRTWAKIVELR